MHAASAADILDASSNRGVGGMGRNTNRPGIKRSMMAKQRSLDDDELDLEVEAEAEVESSAAGAGGGSGGGGGEDGDEDFVDAASSAGAGESSGSTLQGKAKYGPDSCGGEMRKFDHKS